MIRRIITPRANWEQRVESVGLIYHHTAAGAYWDESLCYELTLEEVLRIERATTELHRLALEAAQHIIDNHRYSEFGIPAWVVPLIENAWRSEPPSLYGRMDLAFDGDRVTLLEYNADTPTALVEAAVAQWFWLQDVSPTADQFNSLHEKLIAKWKDLAAWSPVHFAHVNQAEGEDLMTVTYLRDTAEQAGVQTFGLAVEDIGWDGDAFVDLDNRPIRTLFKLYPWEWLIHESFGVHVAHVEMDWIEPVWKMLLSNKAILAVMWEIAPDHPHLLPAYLDGPRELTAYARKPRLSREGSNVTIVDGSRGDHEDGDYGDEGFVYQALAGLSEHAPILGSWLIDGEPAGMGIREPQSGRRITTNVSRFVPHRIVYFYPRGFAPRTPRHALSRARRCPSTTWRFVRCVSVVGCQ
jgi:glutathionylspermidine synthase